MIHVTAYAVCYQNPCKMCSGYDSVKVAMLKSLHCHVYAICAETGTHCLISVIACLLDSCQAGYELRIGVVHVKPQYMDLYAVVNCGHLYSRNNCYMTITTG